jgi:hypothetical protein
VLTGTKLSWDGSDIGTELPAKYVPSLRDGRLPVVVSQGVPGDIISPTVLAVVTLPIAALGWWFMVAVLIERGRGSAERHRRRWAEPERCGRRPRVLVTPVRGP